MTEPIPQNFNYLIAAGDSTFFIASLEYLSLAPFPLEPNGSLDWSDSATNWITSNSNFTQWTYHIRPGLTWSNGTAVTGSDIAAWMSPAYAINPNYDITRAHTEVTGVQVVNSDTATVILNTTDAQFPNELSTYFYAPMVSPTDVAKGPSDPLFGTGIADGPWYISNYTSGDTTMTMLPNPYWPGPKPTACAIDVFFVETFSQITPFLVSGQADFAGPIAVENIAGFSSNHNIQLDTVKANQATPLWYNVTRYPYNMTEFRQALAYSINSSAIVQQALFGYAVPSNNAQGGVPSVYPEYNQNQQQYPYNVSKALSLLHQIGFTGGGPNTP
ncbi:MAG: ABC transporter substrate-binding protein, partial [Nitrososphaerales archaeon]